MNETVITGIIFAVMVAAVAYSVRGRTRNLGSISGRDWAIYITLALLLVTGIILYAEYGKPR